MTSSPAGRARPAEFDADLADAADTLARCALQVIGQRYPHKLDHLILDEGDGRLPSDLHPIFDGSYDWHSSVHMHWSLLRLRAIGVDAAVAAAIGARFDTAFTPAAVRCELDYVNTPGRSSFERPYGLAWLLALQAELVRQGRAGHADAVRWAETLRPLSDVLAGRLAGYFGQLHYPIRAGTHANTAFSMLLALDHAEAVGDRRLGNAVRQRAHGWFGDDRDYPARYEPSGSDFLSPGLCEALLMKRLLAPAGFAEWWKAFAPSDPSAWHCPAVVTDRTDAQIVHLDGLNLSRAWCLHGLVAGEAPPDAMWLAGAASAHWRAAWPHVTDGDFVATHWLVTFTLLR